MQTVKWGGLKQIKRTTAVCNGLNRNLTNYKQDEIKL